VCVTLFGKKRVFEEMVKYLEMRASGLSKWVLIQ